MDPSRSHGFLLPTGERVAAKRPDEGGAFLYCAEQSFSIEVDIAAAAEKP